MAIKETDRVARANYKKKIVRITIELYPTDQDIKAHLENVRIPKATYIKRLLREDIEKMRYFGNI